MIVSIVSPCRNEISQVDRFLRTVTQQQATGFELEILVADGESNDGTAEVLAAWNATEPRIRVIPNPGRIVSTGLNAAIRAARGEIVVRMDLHTEYAEDYVAQCVMALEQTRATCVGGPWLAKGTSPTQRAISKAFGSTFGSGGAKSRRRNYTGFVDSVYLGTWRRADLLALGGFDERLVRNQDDELCLRIRRSGGTIWQTPAIRSEYIPRASFSELWHQFYQYGYWRVGVIKKHRIPGSVRQLAPTLFIAILLILTVLGLVVPLATIVAVGLCIAYGALAIMAAAVASDSHDPRSLALVVLSFACMHLGYGLGLGHGILDFLILRRSRTGLSNRRM